MTQELTEAKHHGGGAAGARQRNSTRRSRPLKLRAAGAGPAGCARSSVFSTAENHDPAAGYRLHGEIETARPLRAPAGKVSITGWCLAAGQPEPPSVRSGHRRGRTAPDRPFQPLRCAAAFAASAAAVCGFAIEGWLPAGFTPSRSRRTADGTWQAFKTLSLAVDPRPLLAEIESPAAGSVTQRVAVRGWPSTRINRSRNSTLRYGHQEIALRSGRTARADVPLRHRDSPAAATAGFSSRVILSAGADRCV